MEEAKRTQYFQIREYCMEHGSINRFDAINSLNPAVYELSARICEMERKMGDKFTHERKKFKSADGTVVKYVQYNYEGRDLKS